MTLANSLRTGPDERGHFGQFGGRYVAETLMPLILDLEREYEAAKVDGIHPVKVFFKVTLPLIRPALMVAIIFRAMDALRVFDVIYVLTANTPSTMTMSVYTRQLVVDYQKIGYGSAASTLLFMTIALCIALYVTVGKVRFDTE